MDIAGYEGFYQVSDQGNVRSLDRKVYHSKNNRNHSIKGKLLKQRKNNCGYPIVNLNKNGISHTKFVHRLMGMAFIPNADNKCCINHKNGNKSDNVISNLEWSTHKENVIHAYRNGLNSLSKPIIDEETGARYYSIQEAVDTLNLNYNTVCKQLKSNNASGLRYAG